MMKNWKSLILVPGGIVALLLGAGVGIATAQGWSVLTPAGLEATDGVDSEHAPVPSYPTNKAGLTYGSAAHAISPETEPDLILVETEDGQTGYVYKTELDAAHGPGDDATPEEVLAWQNGEGRNDQVVRVFDVEGESVVGEFIVWGGDRQDRLLEEVNLDK